MNKFIPVLAVVLFGCTAHTPTRTVLNCQREYILGDNTLFVGGSRPNDQIECKSVRVPVAPKSTPLAVDPQLIDKSAQ